MRKTSMDLEGDDPYALHPNAPLLVVNAAKASLQHPTRPMTPVGRELFGKDSDFAQSRPPSALGHSGSSRLFFNGEQPKLATARLDPYARSDPPATPQGRRSILDASSTASPDAAGTTGRSLARSSSSQRQQWASQDDGTDPWGAGKSKVPTAAETVAAARAALAGARLNSAGRSTVSEHATGGWPDSALDAHGNHETQDSERCSGGRLSSWAPQPTTMTSGGVTAEVLDVRDEPHYSSSDDDSSGGSRPSSGSQSRRQPPDKGSAGGQQGPGTTAPVMLDPSPAFLSWRADTEQVLHQLGVAISALAACQQGQAATGPTAAAGGVSAPGQHAGGAGGCRSRQEAFALVLSHCRTLLEGVVHMRAQQQASQWLNSSSVLYRDSHGTLLRMREAITEHVYRLMDSSNAELLMRACSIVLRVARSRAPLLQTGRLLYKLSKDSAHDALFRQEQLLEPMLRTVHVLVATCEKARPWSASSSSGGGGQQTHQAQQQKQTLYEPLVYYCGALKNISNDTANQKALIRAGALHVLCKMLTTMTQHVKLVSAAGSQGTAPAPNTTGSKSNTAAVSGPSQAAAQVTAVLRNLAVAPAHAPAFLTAGALPAFKAAVPVLGSQQELALNLGRVISKLSLSEPCQAELEADHEYGPLLVGLLRQWLANTSMTLRVAFALGNLTTHSDTYRQQLGKVPGALELFVVALQQYTAEQCAQQNSASRGVSKPATEGGTAGAAAAAATTARLDCLVKLLRLVANLAINAELGPRLAKDSRVASCLSSLLGRYQYGDGAEELLLNVACAVTNLSFYQLPDNQVLLQQPNELLRHLTPLLLVDNEEAVVEAARSFGNLSRVAGARQYLVGARVLEALVLLLDHSNAEVLYSVCGTLINFSADVAHKGDLVSLGAPERLVDVLQRCVEAVQDATASGQSDDSTSMEVATLCVVCKALFNLLADEPTAASLKSSVTMGAATGDVDVQQQGVLEHQQLGWLAGILAGVLGDAALVQRPEVMQVVQRLSGVVARLMA